MRYNILDTYVILIRHTCIMQILEDNIHRYITYRVIHSHLYPGMKNELNMHHGHAPGHALGQSLWRDFLNTNCSLGTLLIHSADFVQYL